jgi:hypothetical protein
MTARRNFYLYMSLAFGLVVLGGFAPTYFLRSLSDLPPLSVRGHIHGAVFTAWVVLLIAQATLVQAGRRDLHRRLGIAGAGLAVLMIAVGAAAAIGVAARFESTGFRPLGMAPTAFLGAQLLELLQFAVLIGLAIRFRRQFDVHKRLMLLATITILPSAVARFHLEKHGIDFPHMATLLTYTLIGVAAAYDFVRTRRVHAAYLWGGPAMIAWMFLRDAIGQSAAWQPIARWLID